MPRNRVATEVLAARGAFDRHPERERERLAEIKPEGELGTPPKSLNAKQKRVWRELAQIVPNGVAASSDRFIFELLVCLMSKFREGQATAGEAKQIESLLSKMGMTPSDRSRVGGKPPLKPDYDPLDEFVQ